MDVVAIREQPERRLEKRREVVVNAEEGRRSESRMAETQLTEIRISKTLAKLKKKANRRRVVSDSSESCVAKSVAAASTTDEEKREELTLRAVEEVPSGVQVEVPMEVAVESSKERTVTVSLSLPPSEQMRSMESEEVPWPKTSEELAKELTLTEEIIEKVVAQVDGTMVDVSEIPSAPPHEKEVRFKAEKKVSEEEPRESVVSNPRLPAI